MKTSCISIRFAGDVGVLKPSANVPFNFQCKNKNRPFTDNSCEPQFTGWKMKNFILKLNKADSCIKTKNGDIVLIENIVTSKLNSDDILIIGRKFNKLTDFFDNPCSSRLLGIESASNLSHLQSWKLSDIKEKMMCLPLTNINVFVILPLLHLQ